MPHGGAGRTRGGPFVNLEQADRRSLIGISRGARCASRVRDAASCSAAWRRIHSGTWYHLPVTKRTHRPHPILALLLWASCALAAAAWAWHTGLTPSEVPVAIASLVARIGPWAIGSYLLLFLLRPLVLVPPTWLSIAGGMAFGPWLGALLSVIGGTLSSVVVFALSRLNFQASVEAHEGERMKRLSARFETRGGVEALVFLRLLPLPIPSDLLSTAAGISRMRRRDFVLSTLLGSGPELAMYALLGTSVRDARMLFIVGGIVVAALVVLFILHRRGARGLAL